MEPIRFEGVVYKVQTLVGGGARVAFDLPASEIMAAAQMMAVADVTGITVEVEVRIIKGDDKTSDW